MTEERQWANRAIWSKKFALFVCVWQFPPPFYAKERRAAVSKLLRSHQKNEWPWAIYSGCSWLKSHGSHSLFFTSKSLFRSQERSKLLKKMMSKFPNLSLFPALMFTSFSLFSFLSPIFSCFPPTVKPVLHPCYAYQSNDAAQNEIKIRMNSFALHFFPGIKTALFARTLPPLSPPSFQTWTIKTV